MRRLRPLLLLAILLILVGVATVYFAQRELERRHSPALPKTLPADISAAAPDWIWTQVNEKGVEVIRLSAKSFQQIKDPPRMRLGQVELRLLDGNGETFDRFVTEKAEFQMDGSTLRADGDVKITTGEPVDGQSSRRSVFVQTSGLTFDAKSGRAFTDRPATFQFDGGEGKSVGASYDPGNRELQLHSRAEVIWRGRKSKSRPMKVEAGELIYKERDSVIVLQKSSRLMREGMVTESDRGVVFLENGEIRRLEAATAHGVFQPGTGRRVEYAADQLYMNFAANGEVDRVTGERHARVASLDQSGRTTVTANRLELEFEVASGESLLRRGMATGGAVMESVPLATGGAAQRETRMLRSDGIDLFMQPGGREIRAVQTRAPGTIEFLPNLPTQSRRRLDGERISIDYGPQNRIRSLHATGASTRTEPAKRPSGPAPPAMLTWSKELRADFDPSSGELSQLEQWTGFRYEQADRRGRADRGLFDPGNNHVTLRTGARLWDPSGSLAADLIVLDQNTGDVTAEGNVASTREPERGGQSAAVLSESGPFLARAARMSMAGGGRRVIHYEGGVVAWQGGNRIESDRLDIDRGQQTLAARGNVRSQFIERPARGSKQAPVFTLIRSRELDYSETSRTARCRGDVVLLRTGLEVHSDELQGVFAAADGGSNLETAIADGKVRITRNEPGRNRQGVAEHAVYTVAQNKVVLSGGSPEFSDSLRGSTRGTQLTWFAGDDRLLVDGREGQPAFSRVLRK